MPESLPSLTERSVTTAYQINPTTRQRQERGADRSTQRKQDQDNSSSASDSVNQVAPDNASFSAEARALVPYNKAVATPQQILNKTVESPPQTSSLDLPETPLTRSAVRMNYGRIGESLRSTPFPGSILNIFA